MTTAQEIMHAGTTCVQESETLQDAARKMKELDVGALPICGEDDRLHGIITDRDIVVKCLARGKDPRTMTASTNSNRANRSRSMPRPMPARSCTPWRSTGSVGCR